MNETTEKKNSKKILWKVLFVLILIPAIAIGKFSIKSNASVKYPTNTYDLSNSPSYSGNGEAKSSDLYSNFLFTGKTSMKISVTNNKKKEDLKVKIYEADSGLITDKKSTVIVPPKGTTEWTVSGLKKSKKYYFVFYAPCDFSYTVK